MTPEPTVETDTIQRSEVVGDLRWIFDPIPPSGEITGGDVTQYVFPRALDTLVREAIQNSNDQRLPGNRRARVDFEFHDLTGEARQQLLSTLGWEHLETHLRAVATSSSLIAGRVNDTLMEAENGDPLRVLVIKDSGTKGLFGGEDATDGNFAPLCRHRLVTTEDKTMGGGSHGLGKAVHWAFSRIATAAFSSVPWNPESSPPDSDPLRFIVRADLPYHVVAGSKFRGSGWWGAPSADGQRSESVRGARAEAVVDGTVLERSELGTTVVIPWFFEPSEEEPRSLVDIAVDTADSIRRWFWPSLTADRLQAGVRAFENEHKVLEVDVRPDDSVAGFIAAWDEAVTGSHATEPDETAERTINISPPKLRSDPDNSGRPGEVLVRVHRTGGATPEPPAHGERVALVRGALMVVEYWKPSGGQYGGDGWVGVLKAGHAHGDAASDDDIEAFLRASEPPAHDKWEKGTNRLQSEYRLGAKRQLEELFTKASLVVNEMCKPEPADAVAGPQRLAKMFRLPGPGPSSTPSSSFSIREQSFQHPEWTITMDVDGPKEPSRAGWSITGVLRIDSESGTGSPLLLDSVNSPDFSGSPVINSNTFSATVQQPGPAAVTITGRVDDLGNDVAERSRLRIDIRVRRID